MDPSLARRAWITLEPFHAAAYFTPEPRARLEAAGLKGGWMCYFASRAAALGPAPPAVVSAAFCYFHPGLVHRALPDAWAMARPQEVLTARYAGVDAMLRRLLGDRVGDERLAEAATLARRAAQACTFTGRPLAAATAAAVAEVGWPDEPHMVLWHAATVLREHRGDGHVAAVLTAGLDGLEALVTMVHSGRAPADLVRSSRGWSPEEWADGEERLRRRGLLTADGHLSDEGRRVRDAVEVCTDQVALAPYTALGEADAERLLVLAAPFVDAVTEGQGFGYPNPIGLPPRDP